MIGRRREAGGWLAVRAMVLGVALAAPATAEEGAELAISVGAYDIAKTKSFEAGLEYRLPSRAWQLVPAFGLAVTGDGAFWGYAGLRRPFRIRPGWRLTPGFAVSLYEEGSSGKDLGGPIEFRSSLELSRRFPRGSSLGLAVYHLSNSGFYDDNPGSNSVILSWAFPIARR
ncbi:MAG: acyloxyacyl hydrolase [Thermoanaerobaculia bacterium]